MAFADTPMSKELRETLSQDIASTRAPLDSARHAPGYVYTSEEVYTLEKEKLFMSDWLCVGRVAQGRAARGARPPA